jgi:hypothetical protein
MWSDNRQARDKVGFGEVALGRNSYGWMLSPICAYTDSYQHATSRQVWGKFS